MAQESGGEASAVPRLAALHTRVPATLEAPSLCPAPVSQQARRGLAPEVAPGRGRQGQWRVWSEGRVHQLTLSHLWTLEDFTPNENELALR